MPDPAPRPRRDTSAKRQVILHGAIEVFTEKGFDAASMDEIAARARASKRTVYNHFGSKEKLFQAIVGDYLARQAEVRPVAYLPDVPLREQLTAFAQAEFYLVNDPARRGLSKLLTSVFLMNTEFARETHSHYDTRAPFMAWVQAGQADGRLSVASPQLAAQVFYGLVEGCLTWPALMSDGASLDGAELLLEEIASVFLTRYGT